MELAARSIERHKKQGEEWPYYDQEMARLTAKMHRWEGFMKWVEGAIDAEGMKA